MFAAFDWSNLELAGAFVLGIIAGAVAMARVVRLVMEWFRREDRR